jgi:hypothetical protein
MDYVYICMDLLPNRLKSNCIWKMYKEENLRDQVVDGITISITLNK